MRLENRLKHPLHARLDNPIAHAWNAKFPCSLTVRFGYLDALHWSGTVTPFAQFLREKSDFCVQVFREPLDGDTVYACYATVTLYVRERCQQMVLGRDLRKNIPVEIE